MMKEYWLDPVKTGETIRNGWLYTGDLARMDGGGDFYLMDRAADMNSKSVDRSDGSQRVRAFGTLRRSDLISEGTHRVMDL